MLDHGACSLNNNPKNSDGVKKQQVEKKKQNEIIINFMVLFMDGFQLPQG